MVPSDRTYVELCLDSHPEAYRGLVERYQAALLVHLAGRLSDRERAEDVAQEAFVRAYVSMEKLRKPESFFSWLLGIADRVVKEERKVEQRQRQLVRSAPKQGAPSNVDHDAGLQQAIATLPESYREIILLRYYAGLSCSQVAEQLAIPLGTVTKKLSRAYTLLRDKLHRCAQAREDTEVKS